MHCGAVCSGHLNHYTEPIHYFGHRQRNTNGDQFYSIDIKIRLLPSLSATLFYLPSPLTVPFSALLYFYVLHCVLLRFIYIENDSLCVSLLHRVSVVCFCLYMLSKKNLVQFLLFRIFFFFFLSFFLASLK